MSRLREGFARFTDWTTDQLGSPWAFALAVLAVVVWLLTGPLFGFSEQWQLIINTGTTIVTFVMVFVIQASQNRDAKATQLKLDEIIRWMNATEPEEALGAEKRTEDQIEELHSKIRP